MALTEKGIIALNHIKTHFPKGSFSAKDLSDACGEKIVAATLNGVANNGYIIKLGGSPVQYEAIRDLKELMAQTLEEQKKGSTTIKKERQSHGFDFEKYIIDKYGIAPCPEGHYTYKWDGLLNNIPVSIKTEQVNSDIEMADLLRNATNEEDFYLIVGFWEGDKTNIVAIETLLISGKEWHSLFDMDLVNQCRTFLDTITNDYSDDEKWREGRLALAQKWKIKTNNLIRPRFKRDHKSQKRMQCAINNKDFYDYFIPKYRKEI